MRLYVDLRSLQDAGAPFPNPDVGEGARIGVALLGSVRRFLPDLREIVGLLDEPAQGRTPGWERLVDRFQYAFAASGGRAQPGLLFQPSPLTHDPARLVPLLARPGLFGCVLVPDLLSDQEKHSLPPERQRQYVRSLAALSHYRAFGCLSPDSADRLLRLFAPPAHSVAVLLASPDEDELAQRFWTHVRTCWQSDRTAAVAAGSSAARRSTRRRGRMAWIGPWPPNRTGVADHSTEVVRALLNRVDVDLFAPSPPDETSSDDHPLPGSPGGPVAWPSVRREPLTAAPWLSGEYDVVLSVVANNRYHQPILDLHRQHGGPCLLYEPHLAEVYTLARDRAGLAELGSRTLQRTVTVDEAQTWLVDPPRLPALLLDELIPRATPLLVSDSEVVRRIRRQYADRADHLHLVQLPLSCSRRFRPEDTHPLARQQARRRLGLPDDRLILVSPGLVHHAKAPLECIWALEQLHSWGVEADLHFAGAGFFLRAGLEPWLPRLGLQDHVHFHHTWLEPAHYRDHLLAADFALVLRSRGAGNPSEVVFDCIDADLPAVLNEELARTMETGELFPTVPDVFSPLLIAERLLEHLENVRTGIRLGPERERYLREHSPARYAHALLEALDLL
jgi:glycosyltransferase involved in cell wall biosynthesis